MNFYFQVRVLVLLVLMNWAGSIFGQSPDPRIQDSAIGTHAANAAFPFGGMNTGAAAELAQFAFLIGHFDRKERRRDPTTGEWSDWGEGEKTASWIMDGTAILDEHVNYQTGEKVVFIRTYDSSTQHWHHVRVSMPQYRLTEAEGTFDGDEYFNESEFVDAQGQTVFQQYVFYDINPAGYKWRAQRTINGNTFTYWEIEYSRIDTASIHGSIHPDAPEELKQFEFMVGEFARQERRRNTDGSWGEWQAGEWNARYFMNGFGIIDESVNYETGVSTSNTRIFDPAEQRWKVTWFKFPDYKSLTAQGTRTGNEMVLTPAGSEQRYVFSEITPDSYLWMLQAPINGEYVSVYEIRCIRKARPAVQEIQEG